MSKVVILGAGSSKECGFPLGDEIWPIFNSKLNSKKGWFVDINRIFPRFTIEGSKYPPFELFLTLIENSIRRKEGLGLSCDELKETKSSLIEEYVEIFSSLCFELVSIFKFKSNEKVNDNFKKWYAQFFIKLIEENKEVVFISINYDVLIDNVLQGLVSKNKIEDFTYGFDVYNLERQNEKCRTSGVVLLKPHGSINLLQCKICKNVFTIPDYVQNLSKAGKCEQCNNDLDSLILPPIFDKSKKDKPFFEIHQKISEVISTATEILIIGYSLPDYDVNITEAFLKGAADNKNRLRLNVTVVDQNKDGEGEKIETKYRVIFNGKKEHFKYFGEGFKKYAEDYIETNLKEVDKT